MPVLIRVELSNKFELNIFIYIKHQIRNTQQLSGTVNIEIYSSVHTNEHILTPNRMPL